MGLSLSKLGEAARCIGSAVLPRMDGVEGDEGNAIHQYVDTLIREGREAANDALPAILTRWNIDEERASYVTWRARRFEPEVPEGALSEVALCLLEDGSVVRVNGARGKYEMPDGGLVAGTIDVVFSAPLPFVVLGDVRRAPTDGKLWVTDWKSGSPEHVASIERNWQVRAAALLAGRFLGVPSGGVVPAICFLPASAKDDPRGTWRKPEHTLDEADLDAIDVELRELVAKVRAADARFTAGGVAALVPDLTAGPHCRTCPARLACPAFESEARALVRALLDGGETFALRLPGVEDLDDVSAARLLSYRSFAQKLKDGLDRLLQAYVLSTGRALHAGDREWGPVAAERKVYDPQVLFTSLVETLEQIVPRDDAEALANDAFKTSDRAVKASLKAAILQKRGEVKRGDVGRLAGAVFGKAKERGGLRMEPTVKWAFHHHGDGLPVRSLGAVALQSTEEDEETTT
jgi:hypothetical protein